MKKFYGEVVNFYRTYNLENSIISENIKKELFNCLINREKIIDKIEDFDNMENIKNPSFEILSSRKNIILNDSKQRYSVLEYCGSHDNEICFCKSDKFDSKAYLEKQTVSYDKNVKNNSVFFISLAHEIGHCLSYNKLQEIFESKYYEKSKPKKFRETKLFEEIAAWYMALDMCRVFMDKGFDVIEQFENFDQLCDFINLCILSYHTKDIPDGKLYLIDKNRAYDILYR